MSNIKSKTAWYLPDYNNFGDILTPFILNQYNFSITHMDKFKSPDIVGIGSLLHDIPITYGGAVWSTGIMYRNKKMNFTNANIKLYCVRGRLTKDLVNAPGLDKSTIALGDGALVLDKFLPTEPHDQKRFKLGIIPHYVDHATVVKNVPLSKRPDVAVINIKSGLQSVVSALKQCECVLSSSLHGLIASDAYSIPNRQFIVSTSAQIAGEGFKYADYYSCYGMDRPVPFRITPQTTLEQAISQATNSGGRSNLDAVKFNVDEATQRMYREI